MKKDGMVLSWKVVCKGYDSVGCMRRVKSKGRWEEYELWDAVVERIQTVLRRSCTSSQMARDRHAWSEWPYTRWTFQFRTFRKVHQILEEWDALLSPWIVKRAYTGLFSWNTSSARSSIHESWTNRWQSIFDYPICCSPIFKNLLESDRNDCVLQG